MKKMDENQFFSSESEIIDDYIKRLEKKDKKLKRKKGHPSFTRRLRVVLAVSIALLIALGGFLLFYFKVVDIKNLFGKESSDITDFSSETFYEPPLDSNEANSSDILEVTPTRPSKLVATTLALDEDFALSSTNEELATLADEISSNGFTTVFLKLNSGSNLFIDTAEGRAVFDRLLTAVKGKSLALFGVLDLTLLAGDNITASESVKYINKTFEKVVSISGIDGVMLSGVEYGGSDTDFMNYIKTGTLSGFANYRKNLLNSALKALSDISRKKAPSKLLGLITDSIYATTAVLEAGLDVTAETELLRDKNADVLLWMEQKLIDIVFVKAETTTLSSKLPFEKLVKWWDEHTAVGCDLGFVLSSELALKGEGDWKNPDQLGRQLKILNEINRFVFCINSNSALKNNRSGSSELVYKYLMGNIDEDYIMRELSITSPQKKEFTTYENSVAIIGASDPNFPLLLNGKEAKRTADGYFSLQLDLKVGKNTFKFEHKGTTQTFTVNYRYVVVKSYTPSNTVKLDGNAAIMVTVLARRGSSVKAVLNGKSFSLEMTEEQDYSDFAEYKGIVNLPAAKEKDVDLGKIKFTGTHNGVTDSYFGGNVIVKKKPAPSSSAKPNSSNSSTNSGGYIPVGNKLIAEVAKYQVETFDGDVINDLSQPYNNYLPEGTLDYCDESVIYDPSSGNSYRLLRYGKRVYTTSKGVANLRTMRGSLPETNKLSLSKFTTDGSHTEMTLKTDWKAPFKLELAPQKYSSKTGSERGTITAATFNYIDITFCYSSKFDIDLKELEKSPLFSRAQLIKNTADYTLRLYLKATGAFYGWTADYNSAGELVFKFLNPKKATVADNKYGGRLDGIKIVVDPGHGGSDPGAVGNVSNKELTEANRSLFLSEMLKTRLEELGATVIMTRSSDISLTSDERILAVRNNNPDLAVSVHRNAANSASANGFSTHYFNPFTKAVADKIKDATAKTDAYRNSQTKWHVFYMSRISNCPVVLTENGFMSNSEDFENIKNTQWNEKCADAIVKGIVDYFLSIG